jgi:hypothetical protein
LTTDQVLRAVAAGFAASGLDAGLEELLTAARDLTHAEAGTVYLRRGNHLHFSAVQNDVLVQRLGSDEVRRRLALKPLSMAETSIASYVALTRATVNLGDAYSIPVDRPYTLYRQIDSTMDYCTRSMLVTPLRARRGTVFGVLQLINSLGVDGDVIAFGKPSEAAITALLERAATVEGWPA